MQRFPATALLLAFAALICAPALATTPDAIDDPTIDPAPCLAAVNPDEAERTITLCSGLIASKRTERDDRIKGLIARGSAFARTQQIDRALVDYDDALRLDPKQPDVLNARGEVWRLKGDRPKALADFSAALKLQPDHVGARTNHKALATELEQLGVQKAIDGKPSFDCRRARRAVEKAICADRDLANLDREVHVMYQRLLQDYAKGRPAELQALKRAQDKFLARRNTAYGKPGYDLRAAMKGRLQQLSGVDAH
ncbi:lysozyme inhibitor LprI family protein [Rhodopseudomonas sp. HC1]|uniref:tetratricopeptide repeat protein n=1 Tax=Rhodopseudomonas infernalis TaxID=2897386 RepID=UPI001EE78A9A|nr:tetratricopeptide repeat protein [Rhodopseudomonas infernalis]MCG6206604.1 lysozyme inhibitor LprI family protein [Rhodopseudomonas infernalis]